MTKIEFIKDNLNLKKEQISQVIELLDAGSTIPFIARYRKEMTNNLDEVQIENIQTKAAKFDQIIKRKDFILKAIDSENELTHDIENKIKSTFDLIKLEDLYLPFKKRKTSKALKAKKAGLVGLAKLLMVQDNGDINFKAEKFISNEFNTTELALDGAKEIIKEWINENEVVRDKLRDSFLNYSIISSKLVKGKEEENKKYIDFFDFEQPIKNCPSYRLLAIFRGESEKLLKVKVRPNKDYAISWLTRLYIKHENAAGDFVLKCIKEAYSKLLSVQLETETRNHFKSLADKKSILTFSKNLNNILLSPPIGAKRILAIDPGFRTGCKVVCIDNTSKLVHNTTVFPHPPKKDQSKASAKIAQLVEMYKIEAIAIGDGTAGRETENWIMKIHFKSDVKVYIVREDGASIYSASKIAREEFPDYDVTVRGAVSIGRRLSDPLAELVKIDPKSLGVGQYQHDVNQVELKNTLDFVVESAVNKIGVNINTASKHLLSYVSGIGPKLADSIVAYREKNGKFENRASLKNVPKLGDKVFQNAAGFLRIKNGKNILDNSAVHPENYSIVKAIASNFKLDLKNLIGNKEVLSSIKYEDFKNLNIGEFTFNDIISELKKPGVDPRKTVKLLEFDSTIKLISDLKVGYELNGIITNVTDFGAFVNIGIKQNGLIHKSKMKLNREEQPIDVYGVDDHVKVQVLSIDVDRNRIGLVISD